MINLAEIRKLTGNQTAFFLVFIGALIAPGVLIIWRFAPHIIEKGDLGVLLLLALSIDVPVIVANLIAVSWLAESDNFDDTPKAMYRLAMACGLTLCFLIAPMGINLMSSKSILSIKSYIDWVLLFELGLILAIRVEFILDARREKRKKLNSKISAREPVTKPN